MYHIILSDLKKCKELKEIYYTLNKYKKLYNLTFNQCRYLLHQYNNL